MGGEEDKARGCHAIHSGGTLENEMRASIYKATRSLATGRVGSS
jgi:hypothetical protein